MDNKELQLKINNLLSKKKIEQPFVRECFSDFVLKHDKLFGNFVSTEELLERLDKNLDKITFSSQTNTKIGEYIGRKAENIDQNEIIIYRNLNSIELSQLEIDFFPLYTQKDQEDALHRIENARNEIKRTILHELTHCAYTIKSPDGKQEQHMFATFGKNFFGADYFSLIGGTTSFVEAITNYISTRIEGKSQKDLTVDISYGPQTRIMYSLAEKLGDKTIIGSAWHNSEFSFRDSFVKTFGDNYEKFATYLSVINDKYHYSSNPSALREIKEIEENMQSFIKGDKKLDTDITKKEQIADIKPILHFQPDYTQTTSNPSGNKPPKIPKKENFFKRLFTKIKHAEGSHFRPILKPPVTDLQSSNNDTNSVSEFNENRSSTETSFIAQQTSYTPNAIPNLKDEQTEQTISNVIDIKNNNPNPSPIEEISQLVQ